MKELQEFYNLYENAKALIIAGGLVFGCFQCFFGYRLFRAAHAIVGFVAGGVTGAILGLAGGSGGVVFGFFTGGILGAFLANKLYNLGVFIFCFASGAVFGGFFAFMSTQDVYSIIPIGTVIGLLIGIFGIFFKRLVIILSSSFGGGSIIGSALGQLFDNPALGIILGIVFGALGVYVQLYQDKRDENTVSARPTRIRIPGSPLTLDKVKQLTKEDLISRQAVRGALIFGAAAFLPGLLLSGASWPGASIISLIFAILGALTGGCANKDHIEYFMIGKEIFKSRPVIISIVVGIIFCLIGVLSVGSIGLSLLFRAVVVLISCTFIGHVLATRKDYKKIYGPAVNTQKKTSSPAADHKFPPAANQSQAPLVLDNSLLWTERLPMVVTQTSIVPSPEDSGSVSLSLAFQNIGSQEIIAVYLSVRCFNLLKQELEPVDNISIQDFVLEPGKSWKSMRPFGLANSDARRIEITIKNVVMQDGSIWTNESGSALASVSSPILLDLPDELSAELELLGQKRLEKRGLKKIWLYQPQQVEHYWSCACGQMNLGDVCLNCNVDKGSVFEFADFANLTQARELRLAEEQRIAAERAEDRARREAELRQKISEQTQAAKENASILVDKSKEAMRQGKDALGEKGKTAWAVVCRWKQAFQEKAVNLWNGKILPNKKRIMVLAGAIAVACMTAALFPRFMQNRQTQAAAEPLETIEPAGVSNIVTGEELYQLFQEVFDSYGDIRSEEMFQVSNELSALKSLVDVDTLPENYEMLYRNWRSEKIADFLEMIDRLQGEYNQIILQDTELIKIWDDETIHYGPAGSMLRRKPCRADYIDFDADGIPELLTVTLDYNTGDIALKIYGSMDDHASQIAEKIFDIGSRTYGLTLVKDSNSTPYICYGSHGGDAYAGSYECYYGLMGNKLMLVDELYERLDIDAENQEDVGWHSFGKKITDGDYKAITQKYEYVESLLGGDYQEGAYLTDHGILSDLLGISIDLNGNIIELDGDTFIEKGNVMAAIEPVLSELGIAFYASGNGDTILLSTKSNTLDIYDYGRYWDYISGEYYMSFNRAVFFDAFYLEIGVLPHFVDYKMFYPINTIVELFGMNTSWNPNARTLFISGSIPQDDRMSNEKLEKIANFSFEDAVAVMSSQGYYFTDATDWDPHAYFEFGKKYWNLPVLPKGTAIEYYENDTTNALWADVTNEGEIIWR